MHRLITAWSVVALLATATAAQAQSATPRPDPADPKASTVPLVHRSALSQYRRFDDAGAKQWRAANDAVERIGGWRAYAREANAPEPAASAPTSAPDRATRPAPPPAVHRH